MKTKKLLSYLTVLVLSTGVSFAALLSENPNSKMSIAEIESQDRARIYVE